MSACTGVPIVTRAAHPVRPTRREHNAHVAAPRVPDPVDRLGDAEPVEHLACRGRAIIEGEVVIGAFAAAVTGTVDRDDAPVIGECVDQPAPRPRIDEQAVPQERRGS